MKTLSDITEEILSYRLIEEKDSRNIIINKLGFPENFANDLHAVSNKYSLWIAKQIKEIKDRAPDNSPSSDWTYLHSWFFIHKIVEWSEINDWIVGEGNIDIRQYDWNSALQASRDWHERIAAESEGTAVPANIPKDADIIKQYKDGFFWLDLNTSYCPEEKEAMGHCGRTSKGDTLYSLRDSKGIAHVTIAISPDSHQWFQCKGRGNKKPIEKYYKYIANILYENDIYLYESEYQEFNDFNNEDYRNYVFEHPDEFENSDELLEKIRYYKEFIFEKVQEKANEYNETALHTLILVDYYNDYIYINGYMDMELTCPLGKSIPFDEYREIRSIASSNMIEDLNIEEYDYGLELRFDVESTGYYSTEIEKIKDLISDLEDFEEEYYKMKGKIAKYLYDGGYIKSMPIDIRLAEIVKKDDEDEEDEDLLTNDGVQIFNHIFIIPNKGSGFINILMDEIENPLKEFFKKILDDRGEQLKMNFESYAISRRILDDFVLKMKFYNSLYLFMSIYFKVDDISYNQFDEYKSIVEYLISDNVQNRLEKYLTAYIDYLKAMHS